MRKILSYILTLALTVGLSDSCLKIENQLAELTITLNCDGSQFQEEGVKVILSDNSSAVTFSAATDAFGTAKFSVPCGNYSATVLYKKASEGTKLQFSGAKNSVLITGAKEYSSIIELTVIETQQILIKELYFGGCQDNNAQGSYTNDAYVTLYNNSDTPADASDIVFSFAAPYNGHGTNKYYNGSSLLYEKEDWIPAYGAIWWFQSEVIIEPYSNLTVAIFGAIDHTATYNNSVDLSKKEYYVMSNNGIETIYSDKKYMVSSNIPASHYLTTSPFTQGKAWALSNVAPAFYIARMSAQKAKELSENVAEYDKTLGTSSAFYVVKMPKSNVVDAIEAWNKADEAKSINRFPTDINIGYVSHTNKQCHSVYRNVDKEETEALEENKGKLIYGYSADPSGIDAEKSMANGAHIMYQNSNNSTADFHERTVAALKK